MNHILIILFLLVTCTSQANETTPFERINNQIHEIIGIEYLLATPRKGPIYSRWGHSAFLLRNPKIPIEQNLVAEFSADLEGKDISYIKGLFGGYKTIITVKTLEEKLFESTIYKNQDLERYIIALRKEEKDRFLKVVIELLSSSEKNGNYTFLSQNCAGVLSKYFKISGLGDVQSRFPGKVADKLVLNGLSPFPKLKVESLRHIRFEAEHILGMNQGDLMKLRSLDDDQITRLFEKRGPKIIAQLLYNDFLINDNSKDKMRKFLVPYFSQLDASDILSAIPTPEILYIAPESVDDFDKINQARYNFFGEKSYRTEVAFIASFKKDLERGYYRRIQTERIKADPNFKMEDLNVNINLVSNSAKPRISIKNNQPWLNFDFSDSNLGSANPYWSRGVPIPDAVFENGKIRFKDLSCGLNSDSSLNPDCALVFKYENNRKSLQIIGFKR